MVMERPRKLPEIPVPPIPEIDASSPDKASVQYSQHRTRLSTHRTGLSEHRTQLSEYRTELSGQRTEMSMRRTGMSFQRTRMSADRTLMSVIRTSLSLIGFGFTIFQVFQKASEAGVLKSGTPARHFGSALLVLGLLMLVGGIGYHVAFMRGLRRQREAMREAGVLHAQSTFPVSLTLIVALLLLALGILAMASIVFDIGPF
jgi:uncharacterized membrane protein YidH (DUF202 family)